jgi:chromosomal replication initiation ATPase DnaA
MMNGTVIINRGPLHKKLGHQEADLRRQEFYDRIRKIRESANPQIVEKLESLEQKPSSRQKIIQEFKAKVPAEIVVLKAKNGAPTLRFIASCVAAYFNMSVDQLASTQRQHDIALARQVAFWISYKYAFKSTTEIGRFYGDRDHTTVLHGIRKIEKKYKETDSKIFAVINDIVKEFSRHSDVSESNYWGA